MKFFKFRGGVHPEGRKNTTDEAIEQLPLPKRLYVPLQQHIGAPAVAVVEAGQQVLKGQLIAASQGSVSANVHAPTSGTVVAVADYKAPHPSGLPVSCVIIESDGRDQWIELESPTDPMQLPPEQVADRVSAAGIVGLGGATFPSAVKFHLALRQKVKTLIINGAECEPYLTADDRLMRERTAEVIDGIRIMMHGVSAKNAIIAIEDNKPHAVAAMREACAAHNDMEVLGVPTRYPMGSEKHLVFTVTGKEIPAGKFASDIGVVVHNVGTAYAVHTALRTGRPLVDRIVTVSGGCVSQPRNLEVPFGTPVSDLVDYCGGLKGEPARLLMGGPLMGLVIPDTEVPIIKGSNGVIALTTEEVSIGNESACIRCAQCVGACPCGLLPLDMAANIRAGKLDKAEGFGVNDCISCGSCSYVCPANIPLVGYFNYAKGELVARKKAKEKQAYTAELANQRKVRMEEAERKRAEQMAKVAEAKRRREEAAAKAAAEEAKQTGADKSDSTQEASA